MFLEGGVQDILLTNQLTGQASADRWASLASRHPAAKLAVCVDSYEGVDELASASSRFQVPLTVLVEVNVGQNRGGVEAHAALRLVKRVIEAAPKPGGKEGLVFGGVQG